MRSSRKKCGFKFQKKIGLDFMPWPLLLEIALHFTCQMSPSKAYKVHFNEEKTNNKQTNIIALHFTNPPNSSFNFHFDIFSFCNISYSSKNNFLIRKFSEHRQILDVFLYDKIENKNNVFYFTKWFPNTERK